MNKRTKRLLAMMSAKPKLRTVSGLPPLSYKAKKAGTLSNYRIYGNTVSGESVGDRTGNLFDINSPNITKHHYYDTNGIKQQNWNHDCSEYIHCKSGVTYTLSFYSKNLYYGVFINLWNSQKQFVSNLVDSGTITVQDITLSYVFTPNQDGYITFNFLYDLGYMEDIMLVEGSAPLPYEPYGYRVPVTVTNGTDTQTINLYLPDQIRKVGDEAEYIDFMEQKQHFADGTSVDVTLPALPTLPGTNVLSVETEVQPSSVEIEGRIKPVVTGGG